MGRSAAILVTILSALFAFAPIRAANSVVSDPRDLRIVVSDIPRFWAAFDTASRGASVTRTSAVFQNVYFVVGVFNSGGWNAFSAQMQTANEKAAEGGLFDYNGSPGGGPPLERSSDKAKALHDIFNISDYGALLRESGYPGAKPACVPAKLP